MVGRRRQRGGVEEAKALTTPREVCEGRVAGGAASAKWRIGRRGLEKRKKRIILQQRRWEMGGAYRALHMHRLVFSLTMSSAHFEKKTPT